MASFNTSQTVRFVRVGSPWWKPVEGGVARTPTEADGYVIELADLSVFVSCKELRRAWTEARRKAKPVPTSKRAVRIGA